MVKQPILVELEYFINGVSNFYSLPTNALPQLSQCSLNLLENLPASREAVFEYFHLLFDASVGNYMKLIENDPNGPVPEDDSIVDIQEALEKLVLDGQHAWSPFISEWSLRILGILSKKYNRQSNKDIGSACNFWLGCNAMRCLLSLTASCFEKLTSKETEDCIATLLNTYVMNSPHFDWVVARLGGCFPFKVISKVLHCGLRAFTGNYQSGLDSEVGILAYLSFAQEIHLEQALKELLVEALKPSSINVPTHVNTIPYLLHLCEKSHLLLESIVAVFLELYNDAVIPVLCQQSQCWPPSFNVSEILLPLSNLALQLQQHSTRNLLMIARIAESYVWCHDLLEHILQDIETLLHEGRTCPLANDITKDTSKALLMASCAKGKAIEQQTAVRLILLFAHQSEFMYHTAISELLTYNYKTDNQNGLGALIRLLAGPVGFPDPISPTPGLQLALEAVLIQDPKLGQEAIERNSNILRNMLILLKLEKRKASGHLKHTVVTLTVQKSVSTILEIASKYLETAMERVSESSFYSRPSTATKEPTDKKLKATSSEMNNTELRKLDRWDPHINAIFEILDITEVGRKDDLLATADLIKLAQISSKYFFLCMIEEDRIGRLFYVKRAASLLSRYCTRKHARVAALRELLEGALYAYGNLFGSHNDIECPTRTQLQNVADVSLLKLNQHQNAASTVRSILHAGTIGNGLKVPAKESSDPLPETRDMLLTILRACLKGDDEHKTVDGYSTLSLLLVELISTDVMYNGLPWPDEEFTKVTMERDLHIRRTFKNAPILWSILALVASVRPSLCFSSVLLRGLCASLLHQWRAKSDILFTSPDQNKELFVATKNLLQVMSMGQLLPPPFNYLHTVIEHFDPSEIATVLKECIWNYMREVVPSPVLFIVDNNGLHWRDSLAARPHPQFVDPLRNIMLRKLPELGTFYHHMFVLPEINHLPGTNLPPYRIMEECHGYTSF